METEAAERDSAMWDLVAADYEASMAPFTAEFVDAALARAALPPGARVLEVAAGTGALTLRLPRDAAEVVATDFAPSMVARLARNLAEAGFAQARAEVADAHHLPLDDARFDAAFCLFALPAFADRGRVARELWRVLRPDGRAVVATWAAPDRCPFLAAPMRALRAALPATVAAPASPPAATGLDAAQVLAATLGDAGFRDVRVDAVTRTRAAPSPAAYWEAFTRASPPAAALARRLGPATWGEVSRRAIATLEAQLGPGPVALAGEAHLAVGRR